MSGSASTSGIGARPESRTPISSGRGTPDPRRLDIVRVIGLAKIRLPSILKVNHVDPRLTDHPVISSKQH